MLFCDLTADWRFARVVVPTTPKSSYFKRQTVIRPSFLYDTYTYTYAYVCYIVPVQNPVPPVWEFASARLMALRRLVAVLPTSSQYPPNLFPTSSLFLSNLNLRPDILIVIRPASVRRHLGVGGRTFGLEAAPLSWGPLLSEIR